MSYVCIKSEPGLWTVGFYSPDGQWNAESDHGRESNAVQRVAWLNGGGGLEPGTFQVLEGPMAASYDLVPLIHMVRKEVAEKVADALECTHCREIARRIAKREGGEPR